MEQSTILTAKTAKSQKSCQRVPANEGLVIPQQTNLCISHRGAADK